MTTILLCDACVKARGGVSRIGACLTGGAVFGACIDCGAAWCLWCRSAAESRRHAPDRRPCVVVGAPRLAPRLLSFRVADRDVEPPTKPDVTA